MPIYGRNVLPLLGRTFRSGEATAGQERPEPDLRTETRLSRQLPEEYSPSRPALLHAFRGKHFMCGEQRIQCSRKARIECHLHEHLDDLITRAADIQRRLDVHF